MKNKIVIQKMLYYIEKVMKYTTDMNYDNFISDDMVVEACVFNLSQLGELANKVDSDYKKEQIKVPWNQIYGLRNKIVHDYEGVNLKLVWEIIKGDLPELKEMLEGI